MKRVAFAGLAAWVAFHLALAPARAGILPKKLQKAPEQPTLLEEYLRSAATSVDCHR